MNWGYEIKDIENQPVNCMHVYSVQDHYLSKTTATDVQSCGLEKSAWLEKLEPYSDFITSASGIPAS